MISFSIEYTYFVSFYTTFHDKIFGYKILIYRKFSNFSRILHVVTKTLHFMPFFMIKHKLEYFTFLNKTNYFSFRYMRLYEFFLAMNYLPVTASTFMFILNAYFVVQHDRMPCHIKSVYFLNVFLLCINLRR